MNILHNLITVISMCYTFIFAVVGAYSKYLMENQDCVAAHQDPQIEIIIC